MIPTPIEPIFEDFFQEKQVQLFVKREDLNHPTIQGNKWRKLKYNLIAAREQGHEQLLTFGGAFSNHLYATAAAGEAFGFRTVGIVRGERIEPLNATLRFAEACGMRLHFVTRTAYRDKENPLFLDALQQQFGAAYVLPEGGSNALAVRGAAEVVTEIEEAVPDFFSANDFLCVPVGTGGTLAGLTVGAAGRGSVLGFSALKGGDFLQKEVQEFLDAVGCAAQNYTLQTAYHFGGYAKFTPELLDFMHDFTQKHGIVLEPIYTAKMLFGIYDLIQKDFFPKNSRIIAVHTGGLQGREGFRERFGECI